METPPGKSPRLSRKTADTPTVSAVLADGRLVEMVHDEGRGTTALVVGDAISWTIVPTISDSGRRLTPYPPTNSVLKNGVVLFPEQPEAYATPDGLLADIVAYIHCYVDLSPDFEHLAAYYALLTWVYDRFNELPYLRLQGDYGSGKTRFLLTVGAICYKPIFASGASTVAPLFHLLDGFAGTLLIDEADFRFSDNKADIVKILNNGNARGFPVLRMESVNGKVFNPRAFQVFGPKIVAMRGHFHDPALESRFLTEVTGTRPLRPDIPLNLPDAQRREALGLRNRLLMFRLRTYRGIEADTERIDATLEPRLNQIFAPLATVVGESGAQGELRTLARELDRTLKLERGTSLEAKVLTVIRYLAEEGKGAIPLKVVAELFGRAFGQDYQQHVTSRWIGGVVRRRLGVATQKSHGTYSIPLTERAKLDRLFERYGVTEDDCGEVAAVAETLPDRLRFEPVDFGELGTLPKQR